MTKKKVLIATGGTGGHIFPAYSLANFFIKKDLNVKLTTDLRGKKFLGETKNFEQILIPSSPLNQKNIFSLILSVFINFLGILKSLLILILNRPSVVFGMGGYSSFPICIAASILRIKFVIYENNLIIGKANRYLLPFAKKIFVSYKEIENIPKKYNKKILEIGNLVREEIINEYTSSLKKSDDCLNILVLGGSQAAKIFAEELPTIFEKLKKKKYFTKNFSTMSKYTE